MAQPWPCGSIWPGAFQNNSIGLAENLRALLDSLDYRSTPLVPCDLLKAVINDTLAFISKTEDLGPPRPKPERKRECSHCGTSNTPSWRRSSEGKPVCNACGIYHRMNKRKRPITANNNAGIRDPNQSDPANKRITVDMIIEPTTTTTAEYSSGRDGGEETETLQECSHRTTGVHPPVSKEQGQSLKTPPAPPKNPACWNCATTTASIWRKDGSGNTVCNACGLYGKFHGYPRPIQMRSTEIKRRNRFAIG